MSYFGSKFDHDKAAVFFGVVVYILLIIIALIKT